MFCEWGGIAEGTAVPLVTTSAHKAFQLCDLYAGPSTILAFLIFPYFSFA